METVIQALNVMGKATAREVASRLGIEPATALNMLREHEEGEEVTQSNGYSVRPGHPINETERSVMIPKGDGQWLSRFDVEHALRMAGISIKGE